MWAVEHFRCLPTDSRLRNLSEFQLLILYLNAAHGLSDEEFRRNWFLRRAKEENRKNDEETKRELIEEFGYTEEEAAGIVEEM